MGICVRTAKLCLYNFNVQLHRACLKESLCTFSLATPIGLKHSVLTAKRACARASVWLQMSFSIRALQSRQGTHWLNGSGTAPRVHSGNGTGSHWGLLWRKMQTVAAKITQPPLTFLSDPVLLRSMAPRSYSSHTSVVGSIWCTWLCHGTFRCIGRITARGDGAPFKAPVPATLDYGLPQILPWHSSATLPGYGICPFCTHAWWAFSWPFKLPHTWHTQYWVTLYV